MVAYMNGLLDELESIVSITPIDAPTSSAAGVAIGNEDHGSNGHTN